MERIRQPRIRRQRTQMESIVICAPSLAALIRSIILAVEIMFFRCLLLALAARAGRERSFFPLLLRMLGMYWKCRIPVALFGMQSVWALRPFRELRSRTWVTGPEIRSRRPTA